MLDNEDIERLKEIFVTKEKCETHSEDIESKLSKDLVRIAVIETKLNHISWLMTAVCGGIITMLIKMFFGA